MHIIVPQEERTDIYWTDSFPMRLYIRVMYALCGLLYGGCIAARLPFPDISQYVIGGAIAIYVLFFRTIHPNGFSFVKSAPERQIDSMITKQELANGNFDGVPEFLQKTVHYPSQEELLAYKAGEEAKMEFWRNRKEEKKAAKAAKKAGQPKDDA